MNDPWWLAGCVDAANCIAAYQPIGADSLQASYINLSNPGTYDAIPVVDPIFDASTGWRGTGTQYIKTGVKPSTNWSAIIRFSGFTIDGILFGCGLGGNDFAYERYFSYNYYENGTFTLATNPTDETGVIAMAGTSGYLDGSFDKTIDNRYSSSKYDIYILAHNREGMAFSISTAYVQAVAFYNIILANNQILAITTAMNDLTSASIPSPYIPSSGMRRWAKVYVQQQQTFNPAWARNSNRIILPGAMLP